MQGLQAMTSATFAFVLLFILVGLVVIIYLEVSE